MILLPIWTLITLSVGEIIVRSVLIFLMVVGVPVFITVILIFAFGGGDHSEDEAGFRDNKGGYRE